MIRSFFKKLIIKSPVKNDAEKHIENLVSQFKEAPQPWDEAKMGNQAEVRESILNRLSAAVKPQPKHNSVGKWAVAASIAIIAGFAWYLLREPIKFDQPTPSIVFKTVKTRKGEIRKLKLSDSSTVWLNANSAITYPEMFEKGKREVTLLEGEAFFDVKHETNRPFQVRAGKTLTNVLGTAFNINAYGNEENISVTVARGKVAVNNNILLPNHQLAYAKATGKTEVRQLKSTEITGWMDVIKFDSEPLKAVARVLENRYQVKIRFSDPKISDLHITARLDTNTSLNEMLDILTLTIGLSYETQGNVITISK